jgi:hypothetical protein
VWLPLASYIKSTQGDPRANRVPKKLRYLCRTHMPTHAAGAPATLGPHRQHRRHKQTLSLPSCPSTTLCLTLRDTLRSCEACGMISNQSGETTHAGPLTKCILRRWSHRRRRSGRGKRSPTGSPDSSSDSGGGGSSFLFSRMRDLTDLAHTGQESPVYKHAHAHTHTYTIAKRETRQEKRMRARTYVERGACVCAREMMVRGVRVCTGMCGTLGEGTWCWSGSVHERKWGHTKPLITQVAHSPPPCSS